MKTETQTVMLAMEDIAILRLPEVLFRTGLSRATLYGLIAKEEFPHPISISARSVGWIEGEIIEWLKERIAIHRKS